jgi:hypothetical protein
MHFSLFNRMDYTIPSRPSVLETNLASRNSGGFPMATDNSWFTVVEARGAKTGMYRMCLIVQIVLEVMYNVAHLPGVLGKWIQP